MGDLCGAFSIHLCLDDYIISMSNSALQMLIDLGVSKNSGSPKWMVYNGKPYEQMDDLGIPLFLEIPIYAWNHGT